jgi:hypothetical protein
VEEPNLTAHPGTVSVRSDLASEIPKTNYPEYFVASLSRSGLLIDLFIDPLIDFCSFQLSIDSLEAVNLAVQDLMKGTPTPCSESQLVLRETPN